MCVITLYLTHQGEKKLCFYSAEMMLSSN